MSLVYRPLTANDIPAVFAVRTSTRENTLTMEQLRDDYGVTPESMAVGLAATLRGWLCEEQDEVVAFAIGDGATGEVNVVAVLPGHEGRGIGKALLGRVQDWLFSMGHREIWLLANPDPAIRATGFYRRLGWRRTGEVRGTDEVLTLSAPTGPSTHT